MGLFCKVFAALFGDGDLKFRKNEPQYAGVTLPPCGWGDKVKAGWLDISFCACEESDFDVTGTFMERSVFTEDR